MWFKTKKVFLTSGCAAGGSNLNAFDNALRKAGIADFNLIKVSSIVPKDVPVLVLDGQACLVEGHGMLVPTIYESWIDESESGVTISAAVGVGVPVDGSAGVIFVAGGRMTKAEVIGTLTGMIKEGMAELRGIRDYETLIEAVETTAGPKPTCAIAAALFADTSLIRALEKCGAIPLASKSTALSSGKKGNGNQSVKRI